MIGAAKKESVCLPGLAALRLVLLLVVALCLPETRVWGFATTPQPASDVFESASPSSIGENTIAWQYDASGSPVAARGTGAIDVAALDFSTGANKAVFYSGPGNRARALAFADRTGAMPIDLTPGGKYLNSLNLYDTLPAAQADAIWSQASRQFAAGAEGKINLFINGARPDRVFHTIERPLIEANPTIYKQTFHY